MPEITVNQKGEQEIIFRGYSLEWDPPKVNMSKYLLDCMKKHGPRISQICALTKTKHTYDDLRKLSVRTALEMRKRGFKKGDFATISCGCNVNSFLPFLATMYLGGINSPIHCIFSAFEYRKMIGLANPKMIFCDAPFEEKILNALKELNMKSEVIVMQRDFEPFITSHEGEDTFEVVDVDNVEKDLAVLLCTSGTSGYVKGVPVTHRSYFVSIADSLKYCDPDDVSIVYSPLSWSSGFKSLAQTIIAGSTRVVANYHPDKNLPLLSEYKVTTILSSPGKIIEMIRHPDFKKYNVQSHLKMVLYGGAPVTYEQAKLFRETFPNAWCCNGYGTSEMCGLHAIFKKEDPMGAVKLNSCGKLYMNTEGKIIDVDTGKSLGVNEKGELFLRSPYMMSGYYKDPEETAKVIDEDGWYHTGDLCYFDEDEYLYCIDRLKEIMKFKSYQISPAEIENVVLEHPGIKEVCVVGKHDDIVGFIPTAFVIKRKEYENLTEDEILNFVNPKLTEVQKLRGGIRFIEKLPMTLSGKVRRLELRNILNIEDKK